MSRICELTGKGRQIGNNVSHANNKTKRVFLPNLQNVTLMSEALDRSFKFRVSANGLRSVEHVGGLDNWLIKTSEAKLSANAVKSQARTGQEGRCLTLPIGGAASMPRRRTLTDLRILHLDPRGEATARHVQPYRAE